MRLSIIVACDPKGVFGLNGKLPWHIPADLKRFKELTTGHAVIMGRRTWESIGSKPLPDRKNILVSSTLGPGLPSGIAVRGNLTNAINFAKLINMDEVFVIGGRRLIKEAYAIADRIYCTEVKRYVHFNSSDDVVRLAEPSEKEKGQWRLDDIEEFPDHLFYVLDRRRQDDPPDGAL